MITKVIKRVNQQAKLKQGGAAMKIEGSIQEIKEFIKEFQPKDAKFSKQQVKHIEDIAQKISDKSKNDLSDELFSKINKRLANNY